MIVQHSSVSATGLVVHNRPSLLDRAARRLHRGARSSSTGKNLRLSGMAQSLGRSTPPVTKPAVRDEWI